MSRTFRPLAEELARRQPRSHWVSLAVIGLLALLNLAACRGTREAQSGYAQSDAAISDSASTDGVKSLPVEVKIADAAIDMPASVPAGATTFKVMNTGALDHDFRIEGQGIDKQLDVILKPGESKTLLVDLTPGTYKVTCPAIGDADHTMSLQFELVVTK